MTPIRTALTAGATLALVLTTGACTSSAPEPEPALTTWAPQVDVADVVQPLNAGMEAGDVSDDHPGAFEDGTFAVDLGDRFVLVRDGAPIPQVALDAIDEHLATAAAMPSDDVALRPELVANAGEITYLTTGMDMFAVLPAEGWDSGLRTGYGIWWYALGGYEPSVTSMFTADPAQVEAWIEEMVTRPTFFYDGTGDLDLPDVDLPEIAQVAADDISDRIQAAEAAQNATPSSPGAP